MFVNRAEMPMYIEHPENYPKAKYSFTVKAESEGFITKMKAFDFGIASLELGAGRKSKEQPIDPAAGLVLNKKVGNYVKKGETIVTCYTNNEASMEFVQEYVI